MTPQVASVELDVPSWLASEIGAHSAVPEALLQLEIALRNGVFTPTFTRESRWHDFRALVLAHWRAHDHVVLRGLPPGGEGASLLCAAAALHSPFRTYRQDKIVKHFRMSPWTTALSHTLQEGHFHTDLNTDAMPPRVTAIQCVEPDPAAPTHGQLRVARLANLLTLLEEMQAADALAFLTRREVTMVSDTSSRVWTGRIVCEHGIRFHPETLRAAERRAGRDGSQFQSVLDIVKQAALAVSHPIDLTAGDVLLVSNVRALHYRSACTVRFVRYPSEFVSRRICVAHLTEEPR